jgi:hypothetical protein
VRKKRRSALTMITRSTSTEEILPLMKLCHLDKGERLDDFQVGRDGEAPLRVEHTRDCRLVERHAREAVGLSGAKARLARMAHSVRTYGVEQIGRYLVARKSGGKRRLVDDHASRVAVCKEHWEGESARISITVKTRRLHTPRESREGGDGEGIEKVGKTEEVAKKTKT